MTLRPETRAVFDKATTGPLKGSRHGWSKEHELYNEAVGQQLERFMNENNIRPEEMTPGQAQKFVDDVRKSRNPRIRDHNLRIYRRELDYLIRRGPRRPE